MGDEEKHRSSERPANDNHAPDGQQTRNKADAFDRVDAVVLSIAQLIGRQIAREHFKAAQAANDNAQPTHQAGAQQDHFSSDDDQ